MTAGFEGNRKAITSGFDKMDEVKKWDLEQLPGYEAIEEDKEPEDIFEKLKILNYRINKTSDIVSELIDLEDKAQEEGNEDKERFYRTKQIEILNESEELRKEKDILEKKIRKRIRRIC